MKVIGLTGGVGSGKSLAARMLCEICHARLLIADELGHVVMEPGTRVYDWMTEYFGEQVVSEDGTIDRAAVAEIVFANEEARHALDDQIHPAVMEYIESYIAERREEEGVIVLESAILFEAGCERLCDRIIFIQVDEAVRRERLEQSRGYSQEKITSIMASQMTEQEFADRCDEVISNNGDENMLREKLTALSVRL